MTTIEVTLGAPAAGGGFVARDPSGRVLFVRHGLPGERVLAQITEEHPRWARADAVEILEASDRRVEAPCPAAGPGGCGGCDYQHGELSLQRELKAELLSEQLRRVAKIDLSVEVEPASTNGLEQRTRIRFGVDGQGRLGMRRHRSHDLVALDSCPLAVPAIGSLGLGDEDWPPGSDVEVVALEGSEPLTYLVLDEQEGADEGESAAMTEGEAQRTEVDGESFSVSPGVFWQIHRSAPELLTTAVLDGLDPEPGQRVLDLYCGAGLFTLPIARRVGPEGRAIGIEAAPAAAIDALRNLDGLPQARILNSPVTAEVLRDQLRGVTAAVIDPPRRGVDKAALLTLIGAPGITRLVMVSCDAATFSRDLKIALDAGFTLSSLRAFDLFEMTEHFETVAVLDR